MSKYYITTAEQETFADTPIGEWLDCLFEDYDSGEQFYAELRKKSESISDFVDECFEVAKENFEEVKFIEIVSAEVAEMVGLDTY